MCNIVPYTLPCCRRVYVAVTRTRDCPPTWPAIKCPKELCFQIGFYPQERAFGTCWRCQAVHEGLSPEQREARRPGIDKALVERFIETPEMKRRHQEDMGFCWFCGCKSGCQSCERWVDPDVEKDLGKNNFWDEDGNGDLEEEERPKKRARATRAKGKGKEKVSATPKQTMAKTRSQSKAGQASKRGRAKLTPVPLQQEYLEKPYYNQATASTSHAPLWHETSTSSSYQHYDQSPSPCILPHRAEEGLSNYQANDYAQYQTYPQMPDDNYMSQVCITPPANDLQPFHSAGGANYQHLHYQEPEPDWNSLVDPALLRDYKQSTMPTTPNSEHGQGWSLINGHGTGETSRVNKVQDLAGINHAHETDLQALQEKAAAIGVSAEAFFEENQRSRIAERDDPESTPTSPKTVRAGTRKARALNEMNAS